MGGQKTDKGQPLMRNYVKYALTKLQLTIEKEKKEKKGVSEGPNSGKGYRGPSNTTH